MKSFFAINSLLFSLLFGICGYAATHEVSSMKEIMKQVKSDTLLVFDLDNTIMEAEQTLGTDQWFEHLLQGLLDSGMRDDLAVEKASAIWQKTQASSRMRPVEKRTPELIRAKQKIGIRVMALTARPPSFASVTQKQLSDIGVDFMLSPVYPKNNPLKSIKKAQFIDGILYAGPNVKGEVLVSFLQDIKYKPKTIIFVDDKAKHINSVEASLIHLQVEYEGFRYGAADKRVREFDPEVARIEYDCFFNGCMLSDEMARIKLGR